MSDVPTVAESGLPGYVIENSWGVIAPKGVPAPIIAKLNAAIVRVHNLPDVKERYEHYKEAVRILLTDRPTIPIFHQVWVTAASAKLKGFEPYVDNIVRPVGLSLEG